MITKILLASIVLLQFLILGLVLYQNTRIDQAVYNAFHETVEVVE